MAKTLDASQQNPNIPLGVPLSGRDVLRTLQSLNLHIPEFENNHTLLCDCDFRLEQAGGALRLTGKSNRGGERLHIICELHLESKSAEALYMSNKNGVALSGSRLSDTLTLNTVMDTAAVTEQLGAFLGLAPEDVLQKFPRLKNSPNGVFLNFTYSGVLQITVAGTRKGTIDCQYEVDVKTDAQKLVYVREVDTITGLQWVYAEWARDTHVNRPPDA